MNSPLLANQSFEATTMTDTETDTNADVKATAGTAAQPAPVVSTGPEESRPQYAVDETKAHTTYSSQCLINATPEEFVVDFVREMKPGRGPNNTSLITVESKVIMSPWAAKRLVIDLARVIKSYEEIYGELEVAPRKRTVTSGADTAGAGAPAQD